jgi:hypothetical protein
VLTDGDRPARDPPLVVERVGAFDELVQRAHRLGAGDGHEVAATEPADFAFDATFLVCAVDTRRAEERVEPIMRSQRDEPVRLGAVAALQHAHHRGFEVVVTDPARDTTEVRERTDVTIEERLLSLIQIDPMEPTARRGETHHEHPPLGREPVEHEAHLPEIDLGFRAQRM